MAVLSAHARLGAGAVVARRGTCGLVVFWRGADGSHVAHASVEALEQTLLVAEAGKPVVLPALVRADGAPVEPQLLQGRWSLVFFGFTSCPDVCPTTLQLLTRLASAPGNAVADGSAQILFVTTDPGTDTPQRMRAYLSAFDPRIVGLTGSPEAVQAIAGAIGAGSQAKPGGMDHSTSLFVIDPSARLAGVMLRPSDAPRIAADLAILRESRALPRR